MTRTRPAVGLTLHDRLTGDELRTLVQIAVEAVADNPAGFDRSTRELVLTAGAVAAIDPMYLGLLDAEPGWTPGGQLDDEQARA